MKRVTVVIPTFNRKEVLARAIRAHLRQSAVEEINEILVIDDGSSDGTEVRLDALREESPVPIVYRRQANRGQAAARNVGIREAQGEIILFADDDIIPAPNLLAEHLRWHDRHPEPGAAVLGFVTWSPEVRPTPFMNWLGLDGPLFAYAHFSGKIELDFRAFYSCNLSLKTEFIRRSGIFDEDFKGYGYEDAELGYRLQQNGMRLLYNLAAVAYHYKRVTFADACRRAEQVALAQRIFEKKDAGRFLLELEAGERKATPPPSPLRTRVAPVLRPFKKVVLAPLRLLLDSPIPLPWSVYRRLYIDSISIPAHRNQAP